MLLFIKYISKQKFLSGFTLVELSIVIVIIGLIVAGVSAGVSLVNQAKLRSIINDSRRYQTAITAFRTQYNAWPGDLRNAQSYWPSSLNGNGNNLIQNAVTVVGSGNEMFLAWDHLARSNLIAGSFSSLANVSSLVGINSPATAISGSYWSIAYQTNWYSFLNLGSGSTTGGLLGSMKALDAQSIDQKVDDGLAGRGKLLVLGPNPYTNGSCTDVHWNPGTEAFVFSDTTPDCRLFFIISK